MYVKRNTAELTRQQLGIASIHLDLVLLAAITISGAMLIWLSIARYVGYNAGVLDLGNMTQAIDSLRHGQPLMFSYKDGSMSRLSLHVELFYLLLGPFYALWPDPRLLLIIQA